MKTITAKELQQNQSRILKEAAAGQEYQVTFHRQPLVNIVPAVPHEPAEQERRGSPAAVLAALDALDDRMKATGDLAVLSYKQLRTKMMEDKYGKDFPRR